MNDTLADTWLVVLAGVVVLSVIARAVGWTL